MLFKCDVNIASKTINLSHTINLSELQNLISKKFKGEPAWDFITYKFYEITLNEIM